MTQRNGDPRPYRSNRTPPAMAFHNQCVLFTFKERKLFEACDMSVRASKPFSLSRAKNNNKTSVKPNTHQEETILLFHAIIAIVVVATKLLDGSYVLPLEKFTKLSVVFFLNS